MGLRGLSVLFASGDDGEDNFYDSQFPLPRCVKANPGWPASSPYVTTVGATQPCTVSQVGSLDIKQYVTAHSKRVDFVVRWRSRDGVFRFNGRHHNLWRWFLSSQLKEKGMI